MQVRGLIYFGCAVAAFCLAIAADVVNVGSVTIAEGALSATAWFTLWTTSGTNPVNSGYGNFDDTIRAARGFVILTLLFIWICIILGLIDMFDRRHALNQIRLPKEVTYRVVMIIAAAVNCFWATIAWPILFALPSVLKNDVQAGTANVSYTINAAPIVMLLAWAFIVVMIVVAIIMPEPAEHINEPVKNDAATSVSTQPH